LDVGLIGLVGVEWMVKMGLRGRAEDEERVS
jgi:hypothetical protein